MQKLTYLAVLCLLCPLIVLAGFAMSPQLDAAYPWLLWLTRHDCVKGWSRIGKWKGVRLATLLDLVGPHEWSADI